ncbi:hypothetical protein Fmac_019596 [Flemingia macrophylla]|uniref:Uncharacterized protein n=1 Tax=Flemingia macrophylla TaxID=520843 RepID=A0ABD1MA70_9FABA
MYIPLYLLTSSYMDFLKHHQDSHADEGGWDYDAIQELCANLSIGLFGVRILMMLHQP